MGRTRRFLATGAAIVATGSFAGFASAAVTSRVAAKTSADVHSLLVHERDMAAVVSHFPGVHSPALAKWEAQYHAAAAAQAVAVGKVNSDLKPGHAVTPADAAEIRYQQSARSISYGQLVKDPSALKGRIVTYKAEVFQYDSVTGTSHFLAYVTPQPFWENLVLFDVVPKVAMHACNNSIIRIWGSVVGAYTYTTKQLGTNTVPEIKIKYLHVLSKPC